MSKKTALIIFALFSLAVLLGGLAWFGGLPLLVGLGGLMLGASHLGAYHLGEMRAERRAERLIKTGAALVKDAVTRNDEQDTAKIKAITGLLQETVKASRTTGPTSLPLPALGPGAPAALTFEEGVFEELEG